MDDDVIKTRLDHLAERIDDGFSSIRAAIDEQSAQTQEIARRLHEVEIGEAGCRAVRAEFIGTKEDVVRLREEIAASKAKIGFVVAGGSVAISVIVGLAVKFLGG